MPFAALLLTLLAFLPSIAAPPSLAAQRLETSAFPSLDAGQALRTPAARLTSTAPRAPGSNTEMVLGGLLLGAGGLFGGALVGNRFQSFPCEDCIEGAFYGAVAGTSLAIPLGVHLADHRRGSLAPALAASLGIGAVGTATALLTEQWGILLAIPVLQIGASIGIERHTARNRP